MDRKKGNLTSRIRGVTVPAGDVNDVPGVASGGVTSGGAGGGVTSGGTGAGASDFAGLGGGPRVVRIKNSFFSLLHCYCYIFIL